MSEDTDLLDRFIAGDQEAFNEFVINVMDAAKAAGVQEITLAAAVP